MQALDYVRKFAQYGNAQAVEPVRKYAYLLPTSSESFTIYFKVF